MKSQAHARDLMKRLTRRDMLAATLASTTLWGKEPAEIHQATGLKIGEITPTSAVIWTRRTQSAARLDSGIRRRGHAPDAVPVKPGEDVNTFEGACPGAAGLVRVTAEPASGRGRKIRTSWVELGPRTDFSHAFRLEGLQPEAGYKFSVETRAARNKPEEGLLAAEIPALHRTAPPARRCRARDGPRASRCRC